MAGFTRSALFRLLFFTASILALHTRYVSATTSRAPATTARTTRRPTTRSTPARTATTRSTPARTITRKSTPTTRSTTSKSTSTSTSKPSATSAPTSSVPVYTYYPVTGARGCPKLPTTTSTYYTLTATDSGGNVQYSAYAKDNGVVIPQVNVPNPSNTAQKYVLNFQNTSRIELISLSGGQGLVVDNRGASIYSPDCSTMLYMGVSNFSGVLNRYGSSASASPSVSAPTPPAKPRRWSVEEDNEKEKKVRNQKRSNLSSLDFELFYVDQCGNSVTHDHTANATCKLSSSSTGFNTGDVQITLRDDGAGTFHGDCIVPGPGIEKQCEDTVKNVLDWPSQGLFGQLTNLQSELTLLSRILQTGVVSRLAAGAAALFDLPAIALGIGILAAYQSFIALGGDDFIAKNLCPSILSTHLTVEAELDTESSFAQINYQTTQPFTAFETTRTVNIPTVTYPCTSSYTNGVTPCPTREPQQYLTCSSPSRGCGSYYQCGEYYQDCICGYNVDGNPMCFPFGFCIAPDCRTDADCPCGLACLDASSCCKRSICVSTYMCTNGASKIKEFFELGDKHAQTIVKGIKRRE